MSDPADTIKAFVALLPAHDCSLTITHNPHRDYYETVSDYLHARDVRKDEIIDDESLVKGDELWELQVYPKTPVGSYSIFGPTLESVLLKALEP